MKREKYQKYNSTVSLFGYDNLMFLMYLKDGMDLSFYIDCNGAKVDEKTILGLVLHFLRVHNLKIFQEHFEIVSKL